MADTAIVGLRALGNDLTRACADSGPINAALAQAGYALINPIAGAARGSLPQDGGGLAGDVRVNKIRSGAVIHMGSPSVRYAGWVEFGGHRRAPHESERPYSSQGRYLFVAARTLSGSVPNAYGVAIGKALNGLPWTNATTDPGSVHD